MAGAGKRRAKREGKGGTDATASSRTGAVADGGDGTESQERVEEATAQQSSAPQQALVPAKFAPVKLELDDGIYKRHAVSNISLFRHASIPELHIMWPHITRLHLQFPISEVSYSKNIYRPSPPIPNSLHQRRKRCLSLQAQSLPALDHEVLSMIERQSCTHWGGAPGANHDLVSRGQIGIPGAVSGTQGGLKNGPEGREFGLEGLFTVPSGLHSLSCSKPTTCLYIPPP
jgi:hypothetical protein